MNDRYDWERDEALKRDRDPRSTRSNDYSGQQGGGSRQQWGSENRDDERYSTANRYGHGYDNRDDQRREDRYRDYGRNDDRARSAGQGWRSAQGDYDRGNGDRSSQRGSTMGGYGSQYYGGGYGGGQSGDYFGPGDFGSGSHAYAANWDRGYGASRNTHPGERWDADNGGGYGTRYGASQATQRQGGMRQMGGGGSYQPGEGYARDDHHRGFLDRAADEVMSWWGDEDAARRREQDAREDHRGRGPSDYTRSDERIREDANDRLTDDWRVDARRISVAVENGELTLTGTVANRQDKHRAEECVERVSGVKHVQNNLRVEGTGTGSSTTGSTGSSSTASQGGAFGYRSELASDKTENRTGATAGSQGTSSVNPEKRD